tara:strand:+ start:1138 stop:1455 length:318 start_codon:yes stop_codon:yes gene_type:complete
MNTEITKTQYKEVVSTLKSEIIKLTDEQKVRKSDNKEKQRNSGECLQWELLCASNRLTSLHIIYNEFRNRPPHTDYNNDWTNSSYYKEYEKLIKKTIANTVEEVA